SLDAERIRASGLAAVIDIDREGLRGRTGRSDHRGRAGERGVRVRTATTGADNQRVNGFSLNPYVQLVVVVLQVSCRRTALHREAEGGLRIGIGQTGNQSRYREEVSERREDWISLALSSAVCL